MADAALPAAADDGRLRRALEESGRIWLRGGASAAELERIGDLVRLGGRPGARIDAASALFAAVAGAAFSARIGAIWPGMRPVRIVAFDKSAGANWGVPWHQDRVIAVAGRADAPGCSNWTLKAGVWHCEPPVDLLQSMLFVRLHLDSNDAENGAMEIAPGSHRAGLIPTDAAERVAAAGPTEITAAAPGDVLVLAMLTLHRSLPSRDPAARRVLRIDYAAGPPPAPLAWAV
ncbi:phytanoyl-CoA dioxygenase family protein [Methylobrevis albus]|uniref:Phytanoyl-CoA dioxygenase family protein n=1 Tax=Methylobrevis albus TaxID=2793297 RepID=A0A931MXE6_9HYPH|nr:phytanoyl-CoA dioxygenase family protein [Methylobrevis albus]MBH0236740.1 phytanoyl-CoA dioxygenase family protein [Methylobrevis albus]